MTRRDRALIGIILVGLVPACTSILGDFTLSNDSIAPGADGSSADGGSQGDGAAEDSGPPADLCQPGGPRNACSANHKALLTCGDQGPTPTPCKIACTGAPNGAACGNIDPSGQATPDDYLTATFTASIAPGTTIVFNSETGEISGPVMRAAGPGLSANGISFRVATQPGTSVKVGIFGFAKFTLLGTSASSATLRVVGQHALSILSAEDVNLSGAVNVQADCALAAGTAIAGGGSGGVGPDAGGSSSGEGKGGGGGGASSSGTSESGGGAGGGHGTKGGAGGTSGSAGTVAGGVPGALYGDLMPADAVLVGGSGGGSGARTGTQATVPGRGGAGGGAVQIVANGVLNISSKGVVLASGCGGRSGGATYNAGGGGGSGGAILLEAATITVTDTAILTANGGGGGCGYPYSAPTPLPCGDGTSGQPSKTPATGAVPYPPDAAAYRGGSGGAEGFLPANGSPANNSYSGGGGGGGAVGRIVLKTLSGTADVAGTTIVTPAAQLGKVNLR
jgi:hypothetical protein